MRCIHGTPLAFSCFQCEKEAGPKYRQLPPQTQGVCMPVGSFTPLTEDRVRAIVREELAAPIRSGDQMNNDILELAKQAGFAVSEDGIGAQIIYPDGSESWTCVTDELTAFYALVEAKVRKELLAENEALKAERRWIPVTVELPKDGCDVYIHTKGRSTMQAVYNAVDKCWDNVDADDFLCEIDQTTHWLPRPFPAPPAPSADGGV